jgi:hypothetical protein
VSSPAVCSPVINNNERPARFSYSLPMKVGTGLCGARVLRKTLKSKAKYLSESTAPVSSSFPLGVLWDCSPILPFIEGRIEPFSGTFER